MWIGTSIIRKISKVSHHFLFAWLVYHAVMVIIYSITGSSNGSAEKVNSAGRRTNTVSNFSSICQIVIEFVIYITQASCYIAAHVVIQSTTQVGIAPLTNVSAV